MNTCKVLFKDCQKSSNLSGLFLQDQKSCKYVQEFAYLDEKGGCNNNKNIKIDLKFREYDNVKIEASSNQGILCVLAEKFPFRSYFIGKPATSQWWAIPDPDLFQFPTNQVGLVVLNSNPLTYKIVTLSQVSWPYWATSCYGYRCDIFDSRTWTWKRSGDVVLPDGVLFVREKESLVINGLIHWLTTDGYVVVFNHEDETYSRFPLPTSVNSLNSSLMEYDGKLGLVTTSEEEEKQVWTVDDSGHHNWRLIKQEDRSCFGIVDQEAKVMKYSGCFGAPAQHVFPFRSDSNPIRLEGSRRFGRH